MHRIGRLEVTNFRSCKSLAADFSAFTAIAGYNNCGKSNLLQAIKWSVRPFSLRTDDFFDPGAPVVVTAEIEGITDDILSRLDPKHRARIEPFCAGSTLAIRRRQDVPDAPVKAIELEIRSADGGWKTNPTGIAGAISALFPEPIEIGAMENATEDVTKAKNTTTIGKLIAELVGPIEAEHGAVVSVALSEVRRKLEADGDDRMPELAALDKGANEKLAELFPGITVKVHVPTPELREILKNGTIRVFEGPETVPRDVTWLGHGAQRSIQMALVRQLAEVKSTAVTGSSTTLLLIDEPELYLHPHGVEQVRAALKSLSTSGYQVVFATHSPLMVSQDDVPNALMLQKSGTYGTVCRRRLADAVRAVLADAQAQAEILFEFENLSGVLFSDSVLVVEGATEVRLLPELFLASEKRSLGGAKIGLVVPRGSGSIPNCVKILAEMGISAKAVVDLDFALRQAANSGVLSPDDCDLESCRGLSKSRAATLGYDVAEDGFPKKSGGISAAQALEKLAEDSDFSPLVTNLAAKLRGRGYWVWSRGTIESYLGISAKDSAAHAALLVKVRTDGIAAVKDPGAFAEFFRWLVVQ